MVVDAFVDASLLTSDQNPADPTGQPIVEVAHEALLRQWPPLREAIEADRHWLRLRSELERSAADWQHGQSRQVLFAARRPAGRVRCLDQSSRRRARPARTSILEASRALATRKLEATRRSNPRLRLLAAGLAALLVVALAAGGLAWQQNNRHRRRPGWPVPPARRPGGPAGEHPARRGDPGRATEPQPGPRPKSTPPAGLISGLARVTHTSWVLAGHTDTVRGGVQPGRPAAGHRQRGSNGPVLGPATGRPHGPPLTGHTAGVWGVAFSPDGAAAGHRQRRPDGAAVGPGHRPTPRPPAHRPHRRGDRRWRSARTGGCWPPPAATRRCGCGTRPPANPTAHPLTGHTDAVYGGGVQPRRARCWPPPATIRRCGCGTRPPANPTADPSPATPTRCTAVAFSPDGTAAGHRQRRRDGAAVGPGHRPTPSADPLTGHTDAVYGGGVQPRTGGCWPPPATTGRCGCGTRPPATPSATRSPATPTG